MMARGTLIARMTKDEIGDVPMIIIREKLWRASGRLVPGLGFICLR